MGWKRTERVVRRVEEQHFGFGRNSRFEVLDAHFPVGRRHNARLDIVWSANGNIDGLATVKLDVARVCPEQQVR